MITSRKKKTSKIFEIIMFFIITYYVMRVITLMESNGGVFDYNYLTNALDSIWKLWTPLNLTPQGILISLGCGIFTVMAIETYNMNSKNIIKDNAVDSSDWEEESKLQKLKDKDEFNNFILTEKAIISRNMAITDLNRNILMVGKPGRGKSRYVFKPNLLNCNGNTIICTDPKGELLRDCSYSLVQQGYTIKVLNLDEKWKGNHYNPLKYIKKLPSSAPSIQEIEKEYQEAINQEKITFEELKELRDNGELSRIQEDDVMSLVNCLIANTKSDNIDTTTGDPYWENMTNLYLQSLIYLALWQKRKWKKECNYPRIVELIRDSEPNDEGKSKIDEYYDLVRNIEPNYIGVKQYDHFKVVAKSPKMIATVISEATSKLSSFNVKEVYDMTIDDDMELERIGKQGEEGRICYFIVTNPNDPTYNFLGSMFYTQVFGMIDANAKKEDGFLPTPVDLYLDEFRQLGKIPRFIEMLAYVRGLNAGMFICVQSLSQLTDLYKENWETILDCCDYILYMGSSSEKTLEYFSKIMGKKTWDKSTKGKTRSKNDSSSTNYDIHGRELATVSELSRIPKGYAILLCGDYLPFYSKLYDLKKHPRYNELFEPWQKGNEDNNRKRYIHEIEMKKSIKEREYEKALRTYCQNNQLNIDDFTLPFATKDMTKNVSNEEMQFYIKNGGFLSDRKTSKIFK